jgi:hypothetical protein
MVFSFGSKSSERLIFQSVPLESKSEELELESPQVLPYKSNALTTPL